MRAKWPLELDTFVQKIFCEQGGQLVEYTDEDLMQEREQELLYIQQESEQLAAMMQEQNEQVCL